MDNEILILFSGGLDSTSILYQAMMRKENIRAVYVEIENNIPKVKVEKSQSKKIIDLLNREFNTYYDIKTTVKFGTNHHNDFMSLKQPLIWLTGLFYSLTGKEKEIRIGYCMNDDAISYIEDIKKIWKSFQPLYDKPLPKLKFPLVQSKKRMHAAQLPEHIFQETVFCEDPKHVGVHNLSTNIDWVDCEYCAACVRSKNEDLFKRYQRNNKLKETTIQLRLDFDEPCGTTYNEELDIEVGHE